MKGGNASEIAVLGREQASGRSPLARGIRRRWRWVVLPALAAMLLSSAYVLVATPRYTAVAQVLLEDRESYTRLDKASGHDPAATIDPEAVQRQAETAATFELARKAIDKLALATNPEFNPSASRGPNGEIDQRVVDKFLSRLTVFPVPRTRMLQIEFVSRDPRLAARGANMVAELYLRSQHEAKANAARTASAQLSQRIEQLRVKAADDDARVQAFRAQSGLLAGANGQSVPTQQLFDLNTQLANARSAEAAAEAKAELLRRLEQQGRLDEAPDSITDQSMRRFAGERAAVKAEIGDASRTLLPLHPRMKELNAELAALDSHIRDAAAKEVRVLENGARIAGDQAASLSATVAQQSRTVATGGVDDVRLRALEQEAKSTREQLESFVQKYREASARAADNAAPADARLLAAAEPPRSPTFPKTWATVLLATLAGMAISGGVAAAAALLSNEGRAGAARIEAANDELSPTPMLAAPTARAGDSPAAEPAPWAAPDPAAIGERELDESDRFDALADRLARARAPGCGQIVLVTGQRCARALAIALQTSRRLSARDPTLLLDLGAAQDWFPDILDRDEKGQVEIAGLADLLAGRAGFGDVIRRDLSSSVDVIASGGEPGGGEALGDVVDALASAYDCLVIHASDWRTEAARTAGKYADAIVVAAPEVRLDRALAAARKAFPGVASEFIPFPANPPQSALDEAA